MSKYTKTQILEMLRMPYTEFESSFRTDTEKICAEYGKDKITATAMLGFDNISRNNCLYCGMRAKNSAVKRYRMEPADIVSAALNASAAGFKRIFLISGEDPKYGYDRVTELVSRIKKAGFHISLALGELEETVYKELAAAGADEYVLKFETSDRDFFNKIKPTTTYEKRLACMTAVKKSGMKLASGNIIDMPGSTDEIHAEDILMCEAFGISWAPIIPYLPTAGTPMAEGAKRGSLETLYREITILRLMMNSLDITAQQPGIKAENGLADLDGNIAAIKAGGNMLFAEMLPESRIQDFNVVDNRLTKGLSHIKNVAERLNTSVIF